jgi:hypothetical protein
MKTGRVSVFWIAWLLMLVLAVPFTAGAQDNTKSFSKEQLEQMVAPIALYPDALLAQVLMASTYPLEVVEAARWIKANPSLKGSALDSALQPKKWDQSVKSLCAFPDVLAMMNDKLDWTQNLGDAFLESEKTVLDTVQRLRAKAQAAGALKTTQEQKVIVEQQTIQIVPANPQVVYVPTYDPMVVYGAWPYPAYPPVAYYPPGYVATASLVSFGVGMAVGAALWGGCNWNHGNVYINNQNFYNYNRNNFNRNNLNQNNHSQQPWQHNPDHRGSVPYRDQTTANRYNQGRPGGAGQGNFRGYGGGAARPSTGSVQSQLGRTDPAGFQGHDPSRPGGGGQQGLGAGAGSGAGRGSERSPSAFGSAGSGQADRMASTRGQSSRGSSMGGFGGEGGSSRGGGGHGFGGGGGRRR